MNSVEELQGMVAALSARVEKLEKFRSLVQSAGNDLKDAAEACESLGFTVDIIHLPRNPAERGELARSLKARGWSNEKIGRVMSCSEKTVRRWLESTTGKC